MASDKIIYSDKVDATISALPLVNKVIAGDMNEIKTVVNAHADEIDILNASGGDATAVTISAKVNEAGGVVKGQVVYISGATGGFPTVGLASNNDFSKADVLAIAKETKSNNQTISVVTTGLLENIDTSTFSEGQQLYLGVNGALSGTHPLGLTASQRIGHVVKVNATTGSIIIEREPLTIIDNEDLALRYTLVNPNAGTDASAEFAIINDLGHKASLAFFGSNYATIAGISEALVLFNPGYNETLFLNDGNKGFSWITDVTDSHNSSGTVKMALSATGSLTATAFIGDGSGLTGINSDNMATANLLFPTSRTHDLAGFGLTFSDGQTTLIGTGTTDATYQLLTENGAGLEGLKVLDNGDVHIGELLQGVGRAQKLAFQPLDTGNFLEAYSANSVSAGSPRFSMGFTSNVPFIKGKDTLDLLAGSLKIKLEASAQRMLLQSGGVTFARFDQNGVSSVDGVYGFGFGTASPNSSAKVEIKSTTKGLLIPRMTGAQASLITPVEGLQVHIITSTDVTFTAFGPWSYVNGTWTIMV
tara:strand:+ start:4798 stop:6396 length:1599 start_codon:yes stop_codon:yes gene_type:complete